MLDWTVSATLGPATRAFLSRLAMTYFDDGNKR